MTLPANLQLLPAIITDQLEPIVLVGPKANVTSQCPLGMPAPLWRPASKRLMERGGGEGDVRVAGEIVLWAVRWYCRYGVSYSDLEQMMGERGVSVDHSTIYRWVQK
jgi:hypothetical protein